jgi:glycosyltransferase involved in cell wall biosynthesis
MKVLYISGPSFLDMDLSFVRAMNQHAECRYLCDIYPKLHKATALDLSDAPAKATIFPMAEMHGMQSFADIVPIEKCYAINRTSNHPLHPSNLLLQVALFRFICKFKPDIIHFNNQIYFTHFYLFLLPFTKLISVHDPFPHSGEEAAGQRMSQKIYSWLNNNLIRYHLLYNDLMIQQYSESRKVSADRVITSSLGPYEYLQYLPDHETAGCDFLFFGRIQKYKGIDDLLEAFCRVIKEYPDATLTIAGSGSIWFDMKEYNIPARNLTFINRFIPPVELANLLRHCRVVVCPYKDATQSGVVMSAYALKKPVIVTNVGALPSVVEHGITGWIVPPSSPDALAEAMKQAMIRDESALSSMSNSIEKLHLRGDKSWNAIARQLFTQYEVVLNGTV